MAVKECYFVHFYLAKALQSAWQSREKIVKGLNKLKICILDLLLPLGVL